MRERWRVNSHEYNGVIVIERRAIVEDTLGSLRLEGLEPSSADQHVAEAWAAGELSNEDLRAAAGAAIAGESVTPDAPRAA